uniref:DNA polymerase Y-family little finger domain-containing protein n=1 Tax=Timspurckia oligopyrenoides TaxID=708627 RepID=A0A7S0ZBA7_9RHOD|mmetsp:Transcript_11069/g.20014  ORF Transcript_11069/g.20014 Transcript_11069/m.20014 type:complete len:256 (+) Transcript_11069:539-1306(+)
MLAAKNFSPEMNWRGVERWIKLLSCELVDRIEYEKDMSDRMPRSLVVSVRKVIEATNLKTQNGNRKIKKSEGWTKTVQMPNVNRKSKAQAADLMVEYVLKVLKKSGDLKVFPCCFLGLTASNLESVGSHQEASLSTLWNLNAKNNFKDHNQKQAESRAEERVVGLNEEELENEREVAEGTELDEKEKMLMRDYEYARKLQREEERSAAIHARQLNVLEQRRHKSIPSTSTPQIQKKSIDKKRQQTIKTFWKKSSQ